MSDFPRLICAFAGIVLAMASTVSTIIPGGPVQTVMRGREPMIPVPVLHLPHKASKMFADDGHEVVFSVDASKAVSNMTLSWKSTGLCPPDPHQDVCQWLQSSSVVQDLALIGSIPHSGIQQVRVHWLLDSIKILEINATEISYNFTCLETFIDVLWSNGLYPGFEVMGNPSNYFSDFENPAQLLQWRDFIKKLSQHFIDMYGLRYVSKWNFESWNEPHRKAFEGLNMTLKGFLNYYDATAEGLRQTSPLLHLGGPGGACPDVFDLTSYCWALLDHAQNGINYFSGKKDVKLDFISIHKKGLPPSNVQTLIEKEKAFFDLLQRHLPLLATKPIFNDEADPQVRWDYDRWWQADVTYAAMAAKAIVEHISQPSRSIGNYHLLSNDNAFLSYQPYPFTQRTLLARFQVNTTSPPHIQFIRKPIYSVMGMLALLGDKLLYSRDHSSCGYWTCDHQSLRNISLLATLHVPLFKNSQDSWQVAVVVYFSEDTVIDSRESLISIFLQNLPTDIELMYVVYVLDNVYSNPFSMWKFSGSPPTPNSNVFQQMRNFEEPVRLVGPDVWPTTGSSWVNLTLRHPSVALIHLCAKELRPPNQVTNIVLYNVTFNQVLIVWSDSCVSSRCIKTYEVQFASKDREELYRRVNPRDSYFTSFIFGDSMTQRSKGISEETTRGFYRVRAVDYWGRPGPFSLITPYP